MSLTIHLCQHVSSRPIINGDIHITDLTAKNATQPRPAIDYISPPLALVGKILGGIIALVIGLGSFGWLVIASPIGYFRAQYWKYKYSDSFRKHLESLKLPERRKKELLKNPWASQYNVSTHVTYDMPSESGSRSEKGKTRKSDELSYGLLRDEGGIFTAYNRIWKGFDGPPAPQPSFDTFWGTAIGLLIGIGLTASCTAILASMIII
jgi:hypothetical protein